MKAKMRVLTLALTCLVAGFQTTLNPAHAEDGSDNALSSCRTRLAQAEIRIGELLKKVPPVFGEILKSGGTITNMMQEGAKKACRSTRTYPNQHLPTARELARFAEQHGALGIKEISEYNLLSDTEKKKYSLVKGSSMSGKADPFYYSYQGYSAPSEEFKNAFFWSSSIRPDNFNGSNIYGIFGLDGQITAFLKTQYVGTGVFCVVSP